MLSRSYVLLFHLILSYGLLTEFALTVVFCKEHRLFRGDDCQCHTPESIQDFVDDLPLFAKSLEISEDMASLSPPGLGRGCMVADTDAFSENLHQTTSLKRATNVTS